MTPPPRRPITRTREQLTCTECRNRKQKCDRNVPCGSCVRRGDAASCTYERFARGSASERERRKQAEAKLQHLEELVQQLAASQSTDSSAGPPSQTPSQPQSDESIDSTMQTSVLPPSGDHTYSGPTHWSAMLEDIDELRNVIAGPDAKSSPTPSDTAGEDGTEFLFGAAVPLSYSQILEVYLPPRQEVDALVGAYFRASSIVAPVVHSGHFQRRYQRFWTDPGSIPPLWTSMLFSVCHIANTALRQRTDTPTNVNVYSVASAQCLAIGRYFNPQPYAVEALVLFAQARAFNSLDITPDHGMVMASVVRLATSSGYHREASSVGLPVFEQEMRRRTWSLCLQLDLLISFALGLPSNVQYPTWDTRIPHHLEDGDFDEDTESLPPARPGHQVTRIMFYTAKHTLMAVFEKILRQSLSTSPPSPKTNAELDTELNAAYQSLPAILQPRPISEAVVDAPSLITTRLCVLFCYEICRCVLHRKLAVTGDEPSLRICYEASTNLVSYFVDIYRDLLPGGQFESERWFNSTLVWHDFLTGITVLSMVLCVGSQGSTQAVLDFGASLMLLQRAQEVCASANRQSRYAGRVMKLLSAIAVRFGGAVPMQNNGVHLNGLNGAGNAPATAIHGTLQTSSAQDPALPMPEDQWLDWSSMNSSTLDDNSWTFLDSFLSLPSEQGLDL